MSDHRALDRSSWLSHDDYLSAFAEDGDRLAAVVGRTDAAAAVPTCPGWTLLDLVRHLADVYSHKVTLLRLGRRPEQGEWLLADDLPIDRALERHDAVRRELGELLAGAGPDTPSWTWMEGAGEGTSGAWARRMAHEALVHRVDAEAAAGESLHPAAPGLAVDGVNEVLTWMTGDPDLLAEPACGAGTSGTLLVDWGTGGWLVDLPDGGQSVRPASPGDSADAVLRGDALSLDLHLWGRLDALPTAMRGDLDVVQVSGEPGVVERLRARLAAATQ